MIVFQNFAGSSLTGIPASTNTLVAQLVYRTSRKSSNTFAGGAFSMVYTPVVTGSPTTKNYASAPTFSSAVTTKNECVNIYARWCGD